MQDLPIGISEFPELRKTGCLYIDKTNYVYSLLKGNRRTSLSRPRRFGKSLLVSTLEAALQGKQELFKGLWIANSDYDWKRYGVIRLDFSQLNVGSKKEFNNSLRLLIQTTAKKHGIALKELDLNSDFIELITTLCDGNRENSFESAAVLIDEYDYPILQTLHKPELAIEIREILKSFSCVIKAQSALVQFVFVTGVSAFSKSGLSSGLNNLKNLTMDQQFSSICGYTELEVDSYFKEHLESWAEEKKISQTTLRADLKNWYNGYSFLEETPTIYSPFSFTCAVDIRRLKNFWFESATPQFLLEELSKAERQEECKLLELDKVQGTEDLLQTFEIESLPLPSLLFQMGYLTIDTYNPISRNYILKYPNLEVRASLNRHLVATITKKPIAKVNRF